MKLLIEEYQYDVADVAEVLDGLFTLQNLEHKVSVSYVGYYYNPHEKVRDVVFILPKVLINEDGKVFGKYEPQTLIHLDDAKIDDTEKKFLYEFSVWIHRAIVVYNESHTKNDIVLHRQIENEGKGTSKKKSNTLLDVILSLIRFNKDNQQFFTFILKNLHSGFNKINWGKTIARSTTIVQDNTPTYLSPVNKRRLVNFDEELIVIFFSILQYISDTYGYRTSINFGFKLISGVKFKIYLDGYGRTRLQQIKYKYFSDTALNLWNLCYAFFDKSYKMRMNSSLSEYLLVKNFYIVYEAIIDELIGDHDIPAGLKDQDDGKLVDHFYTYEGLIVDNKKNDDIYYIGDSKYYKIGSNPMGTAVYKQYTYARNVIQWNLNLFLPTEDGTTDRQKEARREDIGRFGKIELRDEITEGYNIIPNFFISAFIPEKEDYTSELTYADITRPHSQQPPICRQFKNRLYDRDTLLLSHYDVNFLFVVSLYARNNASTKSSWKNKVRKEFRCAIKNLLREKFDFYAMTAHPDVDAFKYFKEHFQDTLGKTFRPYHQQNIFSLALDRNYPEENHKLLENLRKDFFIVKCPLGENPEIKLNEEKDKFGDIKSPNGHGLAFVGYVPATEREWYQDNDVKYYRSRAIPKGNIQEIKYFVPMISGTISGYYDVSSIYLDVNSEGNARVVFSLGKFHSLGNDAAIVQYGNERLLYYGGAPITLTNLKKIYNDALSNISKKIYLD